MSETQERSGQRIAARVAALSKASFPRFLMVGGGFALIYAGLAALLTGLLPLPAAVSASLAWLACIPPAWFCQRRFTFRDREARRGGSWLYLLTQGLGMLIGAAAGALFARGAFWPDLGVYLAASVLAAVVSYAITRLVIFRHVRPER